MMRHGWVVGLPLHGTTAYQETLCQTIAENRRDGMVASQEQPTEHVR
jgi:hypothetical protein